jgi:hypothetical protein
LTIHDRLLDRIERASLVVRVRCPNELQLLRIRERLCEFEARMILDYHMRLDDALDEQLRNLPSGCVLIEIDTARPKAEFLDMDNLRVAMAMLGR